MMSEDRHESPYKGLTPYDEGDAPYFFGRETETTLITASLFASPLTLLYGASGVGKSSVLRAGVVSALNKQDDVLVVVFTQWQSDPVAGLKNAVARAALTRMWRGTALVVTDEQVAQAVAAMEINARRHMAERTAPAPPPPSLYTDPVPLDEFLGACSRWIGRRLMLILDQFEEYSLYHPEEDDAFDRELPRVVSVEDLSVSVLLSLREDAVAKLDRFEGSIPNLFDNYRRIDHLDQWAAREAVERPVEQFNRLRRRGGPPVSVEPDLVEEVLEQVRTGQVFIGETGRGTITTAQGQPPPTSRIETPYLQLVMTRLWDEEMNSRSDVLRLETLYRLGGAQRIVQTHLDAVMSKLSDEEKGAAAGVFNLLVTPSGTKIAYMVRDLEALAGVGRESLIPVLEKLARGTDRILRPVAPPPEYPGEPRYEIFHDRLAPAILTWRSNYLKGREEEERKRLEMERRRYTNTRIDRLMSELTDEEQALVMQAFNFLVTPSGVRVPYGVNDMAASIGTGADKLDSVLGKLAGGEDAVLRASPLLTGGSADTVYEIAHDVLASPILDWRARYLRQKELEKDGQADVERGHARGQRRRVGTEPPYPVIADLFFRGRIVPFLGPGVSPAARGPRERWKPGAHFLPTAAEVARHLADRIGLPYDRFQDSTDLITVATYYEYMASRRSLVEDLSEIFGAGGYEPTSVHRLIADAAKFSPLFVLTTSYDTLLERAFEQAGVPYDLFANTPDRAGRHGEVLWFRHGEPEPELIPSMSKFKYDESISIIFKMYGSVNRDTSRNNDFILTDLDYANLLGRLSSGTVVPPLFLRRLGYSNFLFMGLGLTDWVQRALVRSLFSRGQADRKPFGWATLIQPSALELAFWHAMNTFTYDVGLDEFASGLRGRLIPGAG